MTETPSPTPSFDPKRSAAIRAMLQDEVRASKPRRRPSARVLGLSSLAVLAGIAVSGTAAFALTGGAIFGALPAQQEPAPTVTSTITLTPTPTPTQEPVAPPEPENPPAPVVRVPSTCDELMPSSTITSILRRPTDSFTSIDGRPVGNDASLRVGGLACAWSTGNESPGVSLSVVPDVSIQPADVLAAWPDSPIVDEPSVSTTAASTCADSYCTMVDVVHGYGILLAVSAFDGDDAHALSVTAFAEVVARTTALPAPTTAIWQPSGVTIPGASDCSDMIAPDALDAAFGTELSPSANADGPLDPFASGSLVNGLGCRWVSTDTSRSDYLSARVLPGGASYLMDWADNPNFVRTTDYPGIAYLHVDGSWLSVAIDGGYVEIQAPADVLPLVAPTIIANVTGH